MLRLNNLKTRAAINAKISLFVICVEAIIYLLLYNLDDCTLGIVRGIIWGIVRVCFGLNCSFNPFYPSIQFPDVFKGYRNGTWLEMGKLRLKAFREN